LTAQSTSDSEGVAASSGNGGPEQVRWQTHLRRGAACAVVVVAVVLWFLSRYRHDFQVCQTTTTTTKTQVVKKACGPIPIQDFLPVLLILGALIWPDVTEIDVRGLGRIVRRLDVTNEKQQEIAETQDRIIGQLTQVQVGQTANQSVAVNVADSTAFARQLDDVQEAIKGLQRGETVPSIAPPAGQGEDRETLRSELLDAWRELEPWAEFGRRVNEDRFANYAAQVLALPPDMLKNPDTATRLTNRVRAAAGGSLDIDGVRDWYAERQPQLETVRATLNELDDLPDKTLRDALVISRRALDDLRRRKLISEA
jgi:hypothetical protein